MDGAMNSTTCLGMVRSLCRKIISSQDQSDTLTASPLDTKALRHMQCTAFEILLDLKGEVGTVHSHAFLLRVLHGLLQRHVTTIN